MATAEETKNRTISKLALIARWLSLFEHHYKHKHTDQELEAINRSLTKFTEPQLEEAFKRVFESSRYYPKLADIIAHIPDREKNRDDLPPWEKPQKYETFPHKCRDVGKFKANNSWKMLAEVNNYEANHIFCEGPFRSRCPNCGCDSGRFENPFIALLMAMDPKGTKGWNSSRKGHMLCDECAKALDREWEMKPEGWRRRAA